MPATQNTPAKRKKPTTTPLVKLTAAQVVAAVRRHYGAERDGLGPEWGALDEYSLQPGGLARRADLFVIRSWRGRPKGHERHGIEVKVSRSDLLAELAAPAKSAAFVQVSHRFYLAVPQGLIKDTDPIPAEWGIYEINARGTCRKVREAAKRATPTPIDEAGTVEAFRRAARAEARIRDADADDPAALAARLTRQVTSLTQSLHRAQRGRADEQSKLNTMLREIAVSGGWLCVCGKRLTDARGFGRHHADGTGCETSPHRWPEVDLHSLAARLGVTAPDDGARESLPTHAELVERARRELEQPTDATDPVAVLGRLRDLLCADTRTEIYQPPRADHR